MNSYHIKKHRINKLHIPETYDINKIQLGIPVTANEAAIVGLKEVGHIVLPSGKFDLRVKEMLMGIHIQISQNRKSAVMFQQIGYIHMVIPMPQRLPWTYINRVILKLK
ncbi:MAG TPA: hypothetical protein DIV56_04565 [Lachnospiraceae bacterium]|nr:hypothetical protein [Lachnospiraceae bacterium]